MNVTRLSTHRSRPSSGRARQRLCMRCGQAPAAREIHREYAWIPPAARGLFLLGGVGILLAHRLSARQTFVFDTCLCCDARAPRRIGDVACLVAAVALNLLGLWLIWGHPVMGLALVAAAYQLTCRAVAPPPHLHIVENDGGMRFLSLHEAPPTSSKRGGDVPFFFPHESVYKIPLTRCDVCGHVNWTHYGVCMRCRRPLDARRTTWIAA